MNITKLIQAGIMVPSSGSEFLLEPKFPCYKVNQDYSLIIDYHTEASTVLNRNIIAVFIDESNGDVIEYIDNSWMKLQASKITKLSRYKVLQSLDITSQFL